MEGKVKTQVMYRATLSFKQLNDYLRLLLHANLLEEKIEGRTAKNNGEGKKPPKSLQETKAPAKGKAKLTTKELCIHFKRAFHPKRLKWKRPKT